MTEHACKDRKLELLLDNYARSLAPMVWDPDLRIFYFLRGSDATAARHWWDAGVQVRVSQILGGR